MFSSWDEAVELFIAARLLNTDSTVAKRLPYCQAVAGRVRLQELGGRIRGRTCHAVVEAGIETGEMAFTVDQVFTARCSYVDAFLQLR